jgi:hypothetical protein
MPSVLIRSHIQETIMNHIRHLTYALAALTAIVVGLGAAPAFAEPIPPFGIRDYPPFTGQEVTPAHVAVAGGMSGWQITLIAVGAASVAAILAVIADRARTARRHPAQTA